VFVVLCVELFFISLLCVPMPSWLKRPILKLISSGALDSVVHLLKWIFGIILVLFFDALRQTYTGISRKEEGKHAQDNYMALKDDRAKLFRAERNLYLAGGALILLMVLNKLYTLNRDLLRLEASCEAMKKQAEGASKMLLESMSKDSKGDKKGAAKKEEKEEFPAVPKEQPKGEGTVKEETGMKQRKKAD